MPPLARLFLVCLAAWALCASVENARAEKSEAPSPDAAVIVELLEGVAKDSRELEGLPVAKTYEEPAFGFTVYPHKYSDRGIVEDYTNPLALRATATLALPAGDYRVLLRARGATQLFVDDELIVETGFAKRRAAGAEEVADAPVAIEPGMRAPAPGQQEQVVKFTFDDAPKRFRLQSIIGGSGLRPELGELIVAVSRGDEPFYLLAPTLETPLTDEGWEAYASAARERVVALNMIARRKAAEVDAEYWRRRHEIAREHAENQSIDPPPAPADLSLANSAIDQYILAALEREGRKPTALVDDETFLRRVSLDVVGVGPSPEEIVAFQADPPGARRAAAIDRLLDDPRWADHWVSYWQDVLAENPGILKPMLNNTGPFRWWIHESFVDNKPMDRFVTELVMMQGSVNRGGPRGFSIATENDAPMADKGYILSKAFLGLELKCARCHDAPYHPFKQKDTFSLAAMLQRKTIELPATSTVPVEPGGREPLVEITLKPGDKIAPEWPFAHVAPVEAAAELARDPNDSRERVAAILTSPANDRFAEVIVNRLWKRYVGYGLVEPVDDWLDAEPSHPELLKYLARELTISGYDLKHVARLILNSQTYQRQVPLGEDADRPDLFVGPSRRRMTAEQIVDSLFAAAGKPFDAEELNLDVAGQNPESTFRNLGTPARAWEFTSTSNERDRPSLSMPYVQSILDVLIPFGWRANRANPITERDETPTPMQPLVLANGAAMTRVVRLDDASPITEFALAERPVEAFVEHVFARFLSRAPTSEERQTFVEYLSEGYDDRIVPADEVPPSPAPPARRVVSWANHFDPEASRIQMELERYVRTGGAPTGRLRPEWRERAEDVIWALANSPEFMFVP